MCAAAILPAKAADHKLVTDGQESWSLKMSMHLIYGLYTKAGGPVPRFALCVVCVDGRLVHYSPSPRPPTPTPQAH